MSAMRKTPGNLRGIAAMLAAVFVFAIMDASIKHLSHGYGVFQIACLRCVSSIIFMIVPMALMGSWRVLRPANPFLHVARAVLGVTMLATFVYAVRHLSLAETYSLFLCAPLLVTALSVPLLGERVPLRRWVSVAVGLGGVLLMLRPSTTGLVSLAGAAAAAAALCYAISVLTVATLGRTNSSAAMVVWFLLLVGLGAGILAVRDWRAVAPADWAWFAVIGVSGALGQYGITEAFRRASASVVAPFEYSSILWAFTIDWVFWSVAPSEPVVLGSAIVIACGLFIIWDERRLAGLAFTAASPPP